MYFDVVLDRDKMLVFNAQRFEVVEWLRSQTEIDDLRVRDERTRDEYPASEYLKRFG